MLRATKEEWGERQRLINREKEKMGIENYKQITGGKEERKATIQREIEESQGGERQLQEHRPWGKRSRQKGREEDRITIGRNSDEKKEKGEKQERCRNQ